MRSSLEALIGAPLALRRRLLMAWFVAATLALLLPLPEAWHSLDSRAPIPLDKAAHFLGTLLCALLAHWAGWRPASNFTIWTLYAGGMELLQGATGFRAADWEDFFAALAGLVVALPLAIRLLPRGLQRPST